VLYPAVEGMHQELREFGDTVEETLFLVRVPIERSADLL
jgi:hypothetical protein